MKNKTVYLFFSVALLFAGCGTKQMELDTEDIQEESIMKEIDK